MTIHQLRRMNMQSQIDYTADTTKDTLTKNLCWDALAEMYTGKKQAMTKDELLLFCRYEDIRVPPGTGKKNILGMLEEQFDSDDESGSESEFESDDDSDSDC